MKKIILIIPCYNEEENIEKVYKAIEQYNKKNTQKLDYVFVNDASKDNTLEKIKMFNLNYINLITNLGIGGAVQTGYKYAYENDYDIAIQFDGDGQHDINYVSKICAPIIQNKADMVIGTRYLKKSESKFQSTVLRRFGSRIISLFIGICCGKKITDPTSGFRAVNKKILKEFSENYPKEYPEPESTVSMLINDFTVKEVPVSMNEREGGTSSISNNFWKPIDYMLKVVLATIIDSISFRKRGGKNNDS